MENKEPIKVMANILPQLFKKQKDLLNYYMAIEGLPQYPVDYSTKPGQRLIKDFMYRMQAELCEAFDELIFANEYAGKNNPAQALDHIRNYNIEIADAFHFFLEILLYLGKEKTISDLLDILLQDERYTRYKNLVNEERPFKSFMVIGDAILQQQRRGRYGNMIAHFKLATDTQRVDDPQLAGGWLISPSMLEEHAVLLFDVSYSFHKLGAELKSKDWVQSERDLNQIGVDHRLAEAVLTFATYLQFAGVTEISLVNNYYTKNAINLERIKTKY